MTTPPSTTSPRNPAFEKALALLAHPASLAALGLLLLNDHLLRRIWPSWWTGKVGDLAWLLIAPFALAAVLAWLLPLREPARARWTFPLAFGLVGLGFSVLKVSPALMDVAMRSSSVVLRTPLVLRADPTDLLALPALALGVFLWRRPLAPRRWLADHGLPRRTRLSRSTGLLALPLAAMLTLANAAMPDPGITCFAIQDGQVLASAAYQTFTSQDGGRTWRVSELGGDPDCQPNRPPAGEWQEVDGTSADIRYRYQPGQPIQVATGVGQAWQTGFDPGEISEAQELYLIKSRPGNPEYVAGPLDALADPASGNMLFAMGQQGVLIHSPDGRWSWSAVDGYHTLEPFPTADAAAVLLGGMLYLAGGLALLIYASLAVRRVFHWARLVVLGLAWVAWLAVVSLFPPASSYGYTISITTLGILAMFLLLVPLAVELTVRLARRAARLLAPLAVFALLGGLLFLLPYLLWLYSSLPGIGWATGFALALAAATLLAAFLTLRRALQPG